jgi:hypothetical protein
MQGNVKDISTIQPVSVRRPCIAMTAACPSVTRLAAGWARLLPLPIGITEPAEVEEPMNRKTIAGLALGLALGMAPSLVMDRAEAQRLRTLPAGTPVNVTLDSKISTEDAQPGDTWTGRVSANVFTNGRLIIPAGTPVTGVVTTAAQGTHNNRPRLGLAVRRAMVNGRSRAFHAETPVIEAGSKRAKKLGAIALGVAGGALAGSAVGGKKGAVIGGLLGGGASYALTRNAFRTMQLKAGTEVTFRTSQSVAIRR